MFYFGEKYVFGKALIDAYEMEQHAIYPKVALSKNYIENLVSYVNNKKN
jgi:hypothetical protein